MFPGPAERIHWSIDDPVGSGSAQAELEAFRAARDELHVRIQQFIQENKT